MPVSITVMDKLRILEAAHELWISTQRYRDTLETTDLGNVLRSIDYLMDVLDDEIGLGED